jgi:5-methylthioadenosine/S-adenosylhomocysteine deaminase
VRGSDVDLTMVDGGVLVEDGQLKTADIKELIAHVHEVVPGLFSRRAAYLAQNQHGIASWTEPNGVS